MTPQPERPATSESNDGTRVQSEPPKTQDFSNDSTNPTFGSQLMDGGVPGYPFLSPPLAADEIGRLGEYRILKKLGEGGMGFVFRGEDPALKRFIALKVMRPEVAKKPQSAERFLREGRAAAGLKSDHIITIYQVGQANGVPFLAMEFLEGLPLDEWIKAQKKPVQLPQALRVVRDALRGLATAHEKGLIHRDIKPANLWLEKGTSRIKLLDFGLTRGNDADMQLTQEGAVVGTPAYMAPEQASGKPVDPRADLFSIGIVMYQLLAGKNPFARGNLMETLGAIGYETQPPIATVRPDVPKEYSDFLDRMLAKDANGRPAHAKAALLELTKIEKNLADGTKTLAPSAASMPVVAVPLPAAAPQVWDDLTEDDAPPARPVRAEAKGPPKPPANKKLLYGGGLFAFLAVLGGIIIIITNKDGTKTTVEVPDDGTKVEIQKGGKTVASVGGKKEPPKKVAMNADRKAAEFVLANGGSVTIGERTYQPNEMDALPAEPFKCQAIDLPARELTDAEAPLLFGLDGLKSLTFNYALTEPNLAKLVKLPAVQSIEYMTANAAELTDAGLKWFRNFPALRQIRLDNVRFSGSGIMNWAGWELSALELRLQPGFVDDNLKLLKDMPKLSNINLNGNAVTDIGIRHLGEIRTLTEFNLYNSKVTDAGLIAIEKLSELQYIRIQNGTALTFTRDCLKSVAKIKTLRGFTFNAPLRDADVQPLLGLANLGELALLGPNPEFTDTGLATLAGMKSLYSIILGGSRITSEAVKKFRAARPDVRFQGDLATLVDADRAAAERVLNRGGTVILDGVREMTSVPQLPKEPFHVTAISLHKSEQTDADLDMLKDLQHVVAVFIPGPITDAGLQKLTTLPLAKTCTSLGFRDAAITDDGLKVLPAFPKLSEFRLNECKQISGTGLVSLKGLPVTRLLLQTTGFTDKGLAVVKSLDFELNYLSIIGSQITDTGLKHIGGMKLTGTLQMQQCDNLTDAGFRHLENLTDLAVLEYGFSPNLTGATLKVVGKIKSLQSLGTHVPFADADLAPILGLESLKSLNVLSTPLTDVGLATLAKIKGLKELNVQGTKVTAAGVKAFKAALPECKVTSDFDAAADPDRAAAEKLLPILDLEILPAGKMETLKLKAGSPVPAGAFAIVGVKCLAADPLPPTYADDVLYPAIAPLTRLVSIDDSSMRVDMIKADPAKWGTIAAKNTIKVFRLSVHLSDGWIDTFRQFPNLAAVIVHHAKNQPIATLKRLTELNALDSLQMVVIEGKDRWEAVTALPLKQLAISNAPNMDRAACARIAAMPALDTLFFYDVTITDAMLVALAPAPNIQSLIFLNSKIPAMGFEALARMPSLSTLTINMKEFDDERMAQLIGASKLKYLNVQGTSVTKAGTTALAAKLPNITIDYGKGRVKGR